MQGQGVREKKRNSLAFGGSVFELILNLAGRCTEVSLEKYVVHIMVNFAQHVKRFGLYLKSEKHLRGAEYILDV